MRDMSGGPCLHFDCTNRNSFGYCRTTVCINDHYRHEEWVLTSNRSERVVFKPQTNADRLRAMTDEELASIFANFTDCQYCGVKTARCSENETRCRMEWLSWLKSPVEVDNGT